MDWTGIIMAAITTGLATEILNYFRNRKNLNRLNNAEMALKETEANSKKIDGFEKIIENMRTELDRMKKEADGFYSRLSEKDKLYLVLSKEKEASDRKNIDYKSALNCAFLCPNSDKGTCPVLNKKIELDEKRAKEFDKKYA